LSRSADWPAARGRWNTLRQVFAELHAVTVRDTVSFQMAWTQFDSHGLPHDREGTARAAHVMLDQLAW
jgi:hypothetical protein